LACGMRYTKAGRAYDLAIDGPIIVGLAEPIVYRSPSNKVSSSRSVVS
jgi:hypothetical protein